MTNLSEAEQHNYDWLTSVVQDDSVYTMRFKYFAQRSRQKFVNKMKE